MCSPGGVVCDCWEGCVMSRTGLSGWSVASRRHNSPARRVATTWSHANHPVCELTLVFPKQSTKATTTSKVGTPASVHRQRGRAWSVLFYLFCLRQTRNKTSPVESSPLSPLTTQPAYMETTLDRAQAPLQQVATDILLLLVPPRKAALVERAFAPTHPLAITLSLHHHQSAFLAPSLSLPPSSHPLTHSPTHSLCFSHTECISSSSRRFRTVPLLTPETLQALVPVPVHAPCTRHGQLPTPPFPICFQSSTLLYHSRLCRARRLGLLGAYTALP